MPREEDGIYNTCDLFRGLHLKGDCDPQRFCETESLRALLTGGMENAIEIEVCSYFSTMNNMS